MGTLGNTVFQTLMGWIRLLWVSVWNTATNQGATLMTWIGDHWKGLAVFLCAAGLLIDGVVYFFRWQPWRVWRSFFRRIREGEAEEPAPEEDDSGYASPENPWDEQAAGAEWDPLTEEEPWPQQAPETTFAGELSAQPETEPRMPETEEIPYREAAWERQEESNTAAFSRAIASQRRRSVSRLLEDENRKATAPEELIDRYAAYRRPVYPRSWQRDTRQEEGSDEFD